MKTKYLTLALAPILALPLTQAADEKNPFVKKAPEKKELPPPGQAFVNVLEYFDVPADMLDQWMDAQPPSTDDKPLRAQILKWVAENQATLVQTTLSLGTENRTAQTSFTAEQIYPTSYDPSAPGTWAKPVSFQTRNAGFTTIAGITRVEDNVRLSSTFESVEKLIPSLNYGMLEKKTQQSTDVFLPKIWNCRLPEVPKDHDDPFADPDPDWLPIPLTPCFPGEVKLLFRTDKPISETETTRTARVVLTRGDIPESTHIPKSNLKSESFTISMRVVEIPQMTFSAWLDSNELTTACWSAEQAIPQWLESSTAKISDQLSARAQMNLDSGFSQTIEYIYPTEWMPAKSSNPDESSTESTPEQPSMGTSYETRNIGSTLNGKVEQDEAGVYFSGTIVKVEHLGDSVMRRIKSGDAWIPDVTFPLFASTELKGTFRLNTGHWTLIGTTGTYTEFGQINPDTCRLYLMKIE
ncbi:hypothetical protein JIN85_07105 [Luteolibacter pohnpeiensis]|uniref:Uncharacterized protein n=1 Tax=Luteolibacter pohnpeiensis TaxID=454153 RepID=A0A934S2X4_9BACT|nr:hypothetical protein [Luteolibacter pohnpeiensis]MBK1882175.1 hypothetical protein [Luteolibacter pohnpeiensis]